MEAKSPAPLLVDQIRHYGRVAPDALAIRAPGGGRTLAQLANRSERIAARLREAGCRPGDRVAVIGRPSLAWIDVMIGAMFARCAIVPLSTSLTPAERAGLLADAAPKIVFADDEFIRTIPGTVKTTVPLEQLESWIAAGAGSGPPDTPQGADLFSIIYSSGTTGVPKGIAHTAAGRAGFIQARPRSCLAPGRLGYVSTALCTNFSFLGMITPLYWGAGVSVAARFSVEAFFKACEDERISEVSLVPVQVKRIVEDPHFAPKRIESLEFTLVSGSLIDLEIKRRLAETWPGRIVEAYGTTETGGIATLDLKANTDKLDTVGRIIDGVELITLNEDGERLPDDAVGEIAAITPMPMVGYFNRDDLTTQSTWHNSEGRRYVRTGDIGYIGEDGFLRITGRAKDMIISGGLNIFACDIEAVLCEHPAIAEAAAIAVPDERWGEAPYAIVVLREHTTASADELMDWMRARLARTSWPTGLEFTRALPRNEMGKVLKRLLREPFWRGRERGVA